MSDRKTAFRAFAFLRDAMFKSAWGESWDVCDPGDLLQYLIPAVGEALQAIDDPTEAAGILLGVHDEQGPEGAEAISMLLHASLWGVSTTALHGACARAVEQGGAAVVEVVVDAFADELDKPEVSKLIASMEAAPGPMDTDASGSEVLMHALREEISTEGIRFLWEHYEEHLGWDGGLDEAELLLKMYERAVCAVTDPRWLADQVLEVCEFIASIDDDTSAWLPDREQVSKACGDVIDASREPVAARDAMREPFWLAVEDAGDPWSVMAETFRSVTVRVGDHASRRIADVVVRAYQRTMSDTLSSVLTAAQEAVEDRDRTAELVLRAAGRTDIDVDIEHALRALAETVAVLEDPAAEAEVMYAAYISALQDSNDPSSAVDALLEATRKAIEQAEDPAGAVKILVNGLSVRPTGWPPPRPVWLRI